MGYALSVGLPANPWAALGGLVSLFDGTAQFVTLNTTTVSAATDQSYTGDAHKNLVQATGSRQPTYASSDAAFGNQATMAYVAASSQRLASTAWAAALPQPYTVVIVGQTDQVGQQTFSDTISGTEVAFQVDGSQHYSLFAGASLTSGVKNVTAPCVMAFVANGVSSAIYVNNSQVALVAGNAGANAMGGQTLGAQFNGGTPLNGKIAAHAVYSRSLSAADMRTIFLFASGKYAIQGVT